jgi:hypothetical protein
MASNLKSAGIGLSAFVPVSLMVANRRKRIAPWNYKQRRNLAIFFLHSAERQKCGELLREMAANYGEYQRLETEALAIAPDEIERARERLGWEPTHRLRATLGEMISRLKRDPRRWYKENKLNWAEEAREKAAGGG